VRIFPLSFSSSARVGRFIFSRYLGVFLSLWVWIEFGFWSALMFHTWIPDFLARVTLNAVDLVAPVKSTPSFGVHSNFQLRPKTSLFSAYTLSQKISGSRRFPVLLLHRIVLPILCVKEANLLYPPAVCFLYRQLLIHLSMLFGTDFSFSCFMEKCTIIWSPPLPSISFFFPPAA